MLSLLYHRLPAECGHQNRYPASGSGYHRAFVCSQANNCLKGKAADFRHLNSVAAPYFRPESIRWAMLPAALMMVSPGAT